MALVGSSKTVRLAVASVAVLLVACSPLAPTSVPPTVLPVPSPIDTPATGPLGTPGPAPVPSPSPGDGWAPVALAPAPQIDAALTAVAGDAYAADPAAGFRVRSTGGLPIASVLARLRVEPGFTRDVILEDAATAVLRPTTRLAPGAFYRFTLLDPAGTPLTGWAFQVAGPAQVVATIPRDEETDVPATTGIEVTFDRDGIVAGPGDVAVSVLPDGAVVEGRVEMHGRTAVFVPARPLAAGRLHQVTVRAGTGGGVRGAGLPTPVTVAFQVETEATREGWVDVEKAFVTCLVGERPLVAATAWRVGADGDSEEVTSPLPVRVYRLPGEAAAVRVLRSFLALPGWADARPPMATAGLPVVYAGSAPFVRAGPYETGLRLPFEARVGWYLVELGRDAPSQLILQATDVMGLAGVRADRVVAWANDAHNGGPLAAATVDVLGVARLGRTDATGLLVAPTPAGLAAAAAPVLVRVTARDGRRAVIHLAGAETLAESSRAEWWSAPAEWWTALATDRRIYRPTDTVQAWGYLRSRRDGSLPGAVRLRLWRDAGDPLVEAPIVAVAPTTAPTGAFLAEIPISDLPLGQYVLELTADGAPVETASIDVSDLRKPPYRFEVTASPRALLAGDPVTTSVTATFFDGTPVAAIPITAFTENEDDAVARGETSTAGRASVVLRPQPFGDDTEGQSACPSPVTVQADAAVEGDPTEEALVCVFRGTELVDAEAVRDGEAIVVSGAVHVVDFAAVDAALRGGDDGWLEIDPRGSPVGGRRVELRVTEHVLRRVIRGQWYDPIAKQVAYEYEDEVARSSTTTHTTVTRADGTYRVRLAAPSRDRDWEIAAVITDAGGHRLEERAYVASPAAQPTARYDLEVVDADADFAVGDAVTARIARTRDDRPVAMPAGGSNRYLFLLLGPTRFDAVVGRAASVTTRFGSGDEPGLEVQAVWFTGRGYAILNTAEARLRTEDRRLAVSLERDRGRYEPGSTATVTVRTTDAAGRPVAATVLLRGVDEKLVAMGAAGFEDPLEQLYRRLDVSLAGELAAAHPFWDPNGVIGQGSTGGGGDPGDERADLADALEPRLVTSDADGRASVTFDLPDDVTSWAVAATAFTADRRAGFATMGLPVGLPFFVDATIAPEYLVDDRVAIRLRAFGSALEAGTPVRFTVSSSTLGMAPLTVAGTAFAETLVPLPALLAGAQRITIAAASSAGTDRLVRTFTVLPSRLAVGRRETVAITAPVAPPGGPGLTRLVLADAGRARFAGLLASLAAPAGARADERLAASLARTLLTDAYGVPAADLAGGVDFARAAFQGPEGGLAVLPYASPDLELTVRALVADPHALLVDSVRAWLREIAGEPGEVAERRLLATVGLAALGDPELAALDATLDDPAIDGRGRLWAAIGLALLGDRQRAAGIERDALARWGERRGDQVRLRIGDAAEDVSEATELLAVLAALVDDPLAADALDYVVANPPRDDLAVLAQVTVVGRIVRHLAAEPASVAIVEGGVRRTVEIPAGGAVTLEVLAAQRATIRLEPVSGSAAVTATWDEPSPSAADLGAPDPDLGLTRSMAPASPVPANGLVRIVLELAVRGPSRTGEVEVVDLLPSGLAPLGGPPAWMDENEPYDLPPARIEGQRIVFTVAFGAEDPYGREPARVPGTFRLVHFARVVTAGTYAWQPAVARQVASPGLVAVTPTTLVTLR